MVIVAIIVTNTLKLNCHISDKHLEIVLLQHMLIGLAESRVPAMLLKHSILTGVAVLFAAAARSGEMVNVSAGVIVARKAGA